MLISHKRPDKASDCIEGRFVITSMRSPCRIQTGLGAWTIPRQNLFTHTPPSLYLPRQISIRSLTLPLHSTRLKKTACLWCWIPQNLAFAVLSHMKLRNYFDYSIRTMTRLPSRSKPQHLNNTASVPIQARSTLAETWGCKFSCKPGKKIRHQMVGVATSFLCRPSMLPVFQQFGRTSRRFLNHPSRNGRSESTSYHMVEVGKPSEEDGMHTSTKSTSFLASLNTDFIYHREHHGNLSHLY